MGRRRHAVSIDLGLGVTTDAASGCLPLLLVTPRKSLLVTVRKSLLVTQRKSLLPKQLTGSEPMVNDWISQHWVWISQHWVWISQHWVWISQHWVWISQLWVFLVIPSFNIERNHPQRCISKMDAGGSSQSIRGNHFIGSSLGTMA